MHIQHPLKSAGARCSRAGVSVGSACSFPWLLMKLPHHVPLVSSQEGSTLGKSGGAECQVMLPSPRTRCSHHTQSAAFWEMLGQKLCYMFCSPQRTSFPKNLFGSSSTKMKCIRHSSTTARAQQVDWSNYNNLSAGFVGYLHPKVGRFTQSLSLPWSNAANTSNSELSVLWKLGQKGKDPSFTFLMCSYSC